MTPGLVEVRVVVVTSRTQRLTSRYAVQIYRFSFILLNKPTIVQLGAVEADRTGCRSYPSCASAWWMDESMFVKQEDSFDDNIRTHLHRVYSRSSCNAPNQSRGENQKECFDTAGHVGGEFGERRVYLCILLS